MTAHECLAHPWLTGAHAGPSIDRSKLVSVRDKIRAKYPFWDEAVIGIGHLAEYSSLRKLQVDKYNIHDVLIGNLLQN